ncbi:MAG: hypothetical protein J5I93_10530 [Pirellulaceae bacterium]|nr:hypothetical protein [Pirellulaceae bacterium]
MLALFPLLVRLSILALFPLLPVAAGCGRSEPRAVVEPPDITAVDSPKAADAVKPQDTAAHGDPAKGTSATSADQRPATGPAGGQPASTQDTASGTAAAPAAGTARLSPALLDQSLALGREYMLAQQTAQGNFRYLMDALTGEPIGQDNQVRQAGALWGLALIHQHQPSPQTERAVLQGLNFYRQCSVAARDRGAFIEYPGNFEGETGSVALVSLAAIEYLRSAGDTEASATVRRQLEAYLQFLLSLRRHDGRFYSQYRWSSGEGIGLPSSYFDGETLLALTKAARWLDRDDLRPLILESAEAMYQAYVVDAQREDPDSDLTKGFYQWGTMAFREIHEAGWAEDDRYARRAIELGHWMIDVHRTLERRRNTAYAHEGLVTAWVLARHVGDEAAQRKFAAAVDQGLYQLTTWQVGSPVASAWLRERPQVERYARGGVMSAASDPLLRIDTVQHQMHAVILARQHLFP